MYPFLDLYDENNYGEGYRKMKVCLDYYGWDRLIEKLLNNMENVEFHFALEGISGKGKKFLKDSINEAKIFKNADYIDSTKLTWTKLFEMMKEDYKGNQ